MGTKEEGWDKKRRERENQPLTGLKGIHSVLILYLLKVDFIHKLQS